MNIKRTNINEKKNIQESQKWKCLSINSRKSKKQAKKSIRAEIAEDAKNTEERQEKTIEAKLQKLEKSWLQEAIRENNRNGTYDKSRLKIKIEAKIA